MLKPHQLAHALDEKYLNLILLPTEQCNFRCTYCYEDFKARQMEPTIVNAVKELINRRVSDLNTLEISWFGGEPLVAKRVIYDISRHIINLSENGHRFSYAANMTTNGYLLDPATAETLASLGVTYYQISLDGPQAIHDRSRVKANGSSTFARIWSNLLAIRDSTLPFSIMLRVHFSPDTYTELDPLIEAINEEFGEDRRFTVYFKGISRLGGPNDANIRTFPDSMEDDVKAHLEGKLQYKEQIYTSPKDEVYICYASLPNSLVVRSNGDLAKCTVALYEQHNRVGKLNPDGTITVNQDKIRLWMRGLATLNDSDLSCPYNAIKVTTRAEKNKVSLLSD